MLVSLWRIGYGSSCNEACTGQYSSLSMFSLIAFDVESHFAVPHIYICTHCCRMIFDDLNTCTCSV